MVFPMFVPIFAVTNGLYLNMVDSHRIWIPISCGTAVKCMIKITLNVFSPNSSPDIYAAHLSTINRLHSLSTESDIILVVGDFDIPKFK